jgi:hypothetical protein
MPDNLRGILLSSIFLQYFDVGCRQRKQHKERIFYESMISGEKHLAL